MFRTRQIPDNIIAQGAGVLLLGVKAGDFLAAVPGAGGQPVQSVVGADPDVPLRIRDDRGDIIAAERGRIPGDEMPVRHLPADGIKAVEAVSVGPYPDGVFVLFVNGGDRIFLDRAGFQVPLAEAVGRWIIPLDGAAFGADPDPAGAIFRQG